MTGYTPAPDKAERKAARAPPTPAEIALLRTQFLYAQTAYQRRKAWKELVRIGAMPSNGDRLIP